MNFIQRAWTGLLTKAVETTFSTTSTEIFYRKYPRLYRLLGGGMEPSWTGKNISEHGALNIGAVWRCVQVISQAEATLPLHVMVGTATGQRVASEHPLDWVLYRKPNSSRMSSLRMRQTMMAHVLLWGNAYALKVKRGGTGQTIGLWPLTPDSIEPVDGPDGSLNYIYTLPNGQKKTYTADEIFHLPGLGFDGKKGYSVVSMARQTLGLSSMQDEYVAKFFAAGGRRPYLLAKKIPFPTDQKYQEFREKWEAAYNGADNFHKAPILEGDIELKELGMPLDDAQLLDSRKFSTSEICRWFGVQPHLCFDLDRSTNNNIEHQGQEFVQQTMLYWLSLWEQEAETQLLTPGEQGKYYIKHNLSALMRADFESRMKGYAIGLQNGFMNPDQVCDLEDWDRLPNGAGQAYHIQLNMQTLPGTGEPTTAERAALAKISLQQSGASNDGTTAS